MCRSQQRTISRKSLFEHFIQYCSSVDVLIYLSLCVLKILPRLVLFPSFGLKINVCIPWSNGLSRVQQCFLFTQVPFTDNKVCFLVLCFCQKPLNPLFVVYVPYKSITSPGATNPKRVSPHCTIITENSYGCSWFAIRHFATWWVLWTTAYVDHANIMGPCGPYLTRQPLWTMSRWWTSRPVLLRCVLALQHTCSDTWVTSCQIVWTYSGRRGLSTRCNILWGSSSQSHSVWVSWLYPHCIKFVRPKPGTGLLRHCHSSLAPFDRIPHIHETRCEVLMSGPLTNHISCRSVVYHVGA